MSDEEEGERGEPIRVMVVDDHPIWRDGIRADLERSGVATVVAETSDGGEAIEQARVAMPDVIRPGKMGRSASSHGPSAGSPSG